MTDMISPCCKASIRTVWDTTMFFVCNHCNRSCDPVLKIGEQYEINLPLNAVSAFVQEFNKMEDDREFHLHDIDKAAYLDFFLKHLLDTRETLKASIIECLDGIDSELVNKIKSL